MSMYTRKQTKRLKKQANNAPNVEREAYWRVRTLRESGGNIAAEMKQYRKDMQFAAESRRTVAEMNVPTPLREAVTA